MSPLAELLAGPVEQAAPALLGWRWRVGAVVVRLTEVEAYAGADDAGSHARRGPTARNATMFGPPGRLYCYLSYGMHVCANVATGPEGTGSAVLLRAGTVVAGLETARARRPGRRDHELGRGPANLCRALGVTLDHDGAPVLLEPPPGDEHPGPVRRGPRVGLTGDPDRPWRFWLAAEPSVSAYRRSPRAHPRFGGPAERC